MEKSSSRSQMRVRRGGSGFGGVLLGQKGRSSLLFHIPLSSSLPTCHRQPWIGSGRASKELASCPSAAEGLSPLFFVQETGRVRMRCRTSQRSGLTLSPCLTFWVLSALYCFWPPCSALERGLQVAREGGREGGRE